MVVYLWATYCKKKKKKRNVCSGITPAHHNSIKKINQFSLFPGNFKIGPFLVENVVFLHVSLQQKMYDEPIKNPQSCEDAAQPKKVEMKTLVSRLRVACHQRSGKYSTSPGLIVHSSGTSSSSRWG